MGLLTNKKTKDWKNRAIGEKEKKAFRT